MSIQFSTDYHLWWYQSVLLVRSDLKIGLKTNWGINENQPTLVPTISRSKNLNDHNILVWNCKAKANSSPNLINCHTRTTLVDTWLITLINYEILGRQWKFPPYPYIIHVAWCVEHIHSNGVESAGRSFTIISFLCQHNKIISRNNL
jgi:hypothetical protein